MKTVIISITIFLISCSFTARPDYENITKVVNIGLKQMELDGVSVQLRPLSKALRLSAQGYGAVLKAHVNAVNDSTYIISVDELGDFEMVGIIAHELVHVEQYNSGDLVVVGDGTVTYKGVNYNLRTTPYNQRPWEVAAEYQSRTLASKIKKAIRETPLNSL